MTHNAQPTVSDSADMSYSGPQRKYRTIVVDPPWEYGTFTGFNAAGKGPEVRRPLPYPSMTVEEIAAVPVVSHAHPEGANVFCWTTNRYLPQTFGVLTAWGATYSQTLVWHKTGANPITGGIAPTSCEYLIFARFNSGVPLLGKLPDSLVTTKRLANSHSKKPELFLDRIESVSPGPYLELFARRNRIGWHTWGNEALGHVHLVEEAESG